MALTGMFLECHTRVKRLYQVSYKHWLTNNIIEWTERKCFANEQPHCLQWNIWY